MKRRAAAKCLLETVMGVLLWIVFGIMAGSVAKLVMPGPNAGGIIVAILVGMGGALTGGLMGAVLDGGLSTAVDVRSLLMAIFGSLILLLSYRSFAMRSME